MDLGNSTFEAEIQIPTYPTDFYNNEILKLQPSGSRMPVNISGWRDSKCSFHGLSAPRECHVGSHLRGIKYCLHVL